MSVFSRIKKAVEPTGLPCSVNTSTSSEATYLVMNVNVIPSFFADDDPSYVTNLCQLHLFCPVTQNTVQLRKEIKALINSNGFTYPVEEDASDDDKQHIVFEFQEAEVV